MTIRVLLCIIALAVPGLAQKQQLQFEAVSVRLSDPSPGAGPPGIVMGGPGTPDPTRIRASQITLHSLIRSAYGVEADQISGPAWLQEEKYGIVATVPPKSTKEQLNLMLQRLLAERFKLVFHREPKEFTAWELLIAKGGPKFQTTKYPNATPMRAGDGFGLPADRDGYPQLPPDRSGGASRLFNGLIMQTMQAVPISKLVAFLSFNPQFQTRTGLNTVAPGRIVDKTGLNGVYDLKFQYDAGPNGGFPSSAVPKEDAAAPDPNGPDIFAALAKQLGLKLVKVKDVPLDVIVIDQLEKVPTGN